MHPRVNISTHILEFSFTPNSRTFLSLQRSLLFFESKSFSCPFLSVKQVLSMTRCSSCWTPRQKSPKYSMPRYRTNANKVYYGFTIKPFSSHAIACEKVIGNPQYSSRKKFDGRCLYSLVCHAPIRHRNICSRSANKEQQKRHLNTFSSVSHQAWSECMQKWGKKNEARLPFRNKNHNWENYQNANDSGTPWMHFRFPSLWRRSLVEANCEWHRITTPSKAQPDAVTLPPSHHFCSHTLKPENIYLQDNWKKGVALPCKQRPFDLPR